MGRLLLSVHDVAPSFQTRVDELIAALGFQDGCHGLALLVVPRHWNSNPVTGGSAFASWLRDRHAAGAEILLHGWTHRDGARASSAADRAKARWMTAGEGEFLNLTYSEALKRLREGRSLLQDILGHPVEGFVAPAWLYGIGPEAALKEAGFRIAESHMRVWNPQDGVILARGPVITWASRSRARRLSSLGFARLARLALANSQTVRIGVHPGDVTAPSLLRSITATVGQFRRSHSVASYASLLDREDGSLAPAPALISASSI